jgi:hypothetical protein
LIGHFKLRQQITCERRQSIKTELSECNGSSLASLLLAHLLPAFLLCGKSCNPLELLLRSALFLEPLFFQSFPHKTLAFLQDLFLLLNLAPFASINSLFQRLVLRGVNGTMSIC